MGKKKKKEVEKIAGEDEFEFEEPSEIIVKDDEDSEKSNAESNNEKVR